MTTQKIDVIRTSPRGALLISDGLHVAWVMGRTLRSDGSFTPSALEALAGGKTIAEHEADEAAYRASRDQKFQDGKRVTTVTVGVGRVTDYSMKAWRVRTNDRQMLYGRWCWCYEYLPKSQVSVEFKEHATVLSMQKWFLDKHQWLTTL